MANLYTEYSSYPGRQIRYTVVPRMYEPVFFEGVQSADFASNADEVTHGQFGTKGDVIITRDYQNTSGTFSLKEFNNASYVLRAMTGSDPSRSFLFDASRLEHVDVFGNVFNKERTKVMRSTWLIDFVPSVSESESLDDIQTKDIAYTAIRKLDFEGYQIVCQTFAGDDLSWGADLQAASGTGAPNGCKKFLLRYPARIDPTYDKVLDTPTGVTIGSQRHEMCPVQWALRVWRDGRVIEDPDEATIVTTSTTVTDANGKAKTTYYSTLIFRDPLDGVVGDSSEHIVKVMWLMPGDEAVEQSGVTMSPVMINVEPLLDRTAGSTATPTWVDNKMIIDLSKYVINDSSNLPNPSDFVLSFEAGGTVYHVPGDSIVLDTEAAPTTAATTPPTESLSSLNRLIVTFNDPDAANYGTGIEAKMTYTPTPGLVLTDYDGRTSLQHTRDVRAW